MIEIILPGIYNVCWLFMIEYIQILASACLPIFKDFYYCLCTIIMKENV